MKIAIVGAGALGGWLALHLRRAGNEVVLLDGHGSANARASSGDETRVIRTVYKDLLYAKMTLRSMELWTQLEIQTGEQILIRTGVLNLIGRDESRWLEARKHLNQLKIAFEEMDLATLRLRFPGISGQGLKYAVMENAAGYLRARSGCELVLKQFIHEGGQYIRDFVLRIDNPGSVLQRITTVSGLTIEADHFVLAAGPWMSKLLPAEYEGLVSPSRQDLFYFGLPASSSVDCRLPVWCDFSSLEDDVMYYGIPGKDFSSEGFGFKIGEDVAGPPFDTESGDRLPDPAALARVRRFMEQRFPFMQGAPLIQSRVCPYENTTDAHLLADKLPGSENLWVLCGGSGHGYKLGAGIGEYMCQRMNGEVSAEPLLCFSRFSSPGDGNARR